MKTRTPSIHILTASHIHSPVATSLSLQHVRMLTKERQTSKRPYCLRASRASAAPKASQPRPTSPAT